MSNESRQPTNGSKRKRWLIPLVVSIVGLVIQFAVAPIIGMQEQQNNIRAKLWVSAEDIPPLELVYTVSNKGDLRSEYSPSFSYTLCAEQELVFLNPMIWSPSRTYHAPYEGAELVRVSRAEHIGYEEADNTSVKVWPITRFFDKERSSIVLMWELSNCRAEKVSLESLRRARELRVQVSNNYDYPVQYLGSVKLPPLKTNTCYLIQDSPPDLRTPTLLEIRTETDTGHQYQVDCPFIIEVVEHRLMTFDIRILDEPPSIVLVLQPSTVPPPALPPTLVLHWWLVGVIVLIAVLVGIFVAIRLRRKS